MDFFGLVKRRFAGMAENSRAAAARVERPAAGAEGESIHILKEETQK